MGWGPRRRPEPRQARARPGPARPGPPSRAPSIPVRSSSAAALRISAAAMVRPGEVPSHGGRAGGWAPRSFAGCGRSPAGARSRSSLCRSRRAAALLWSARLRASGRRVPAFPPSAKGRPCWGRVVSRALALRAAGKRAASIFCLPTQRLTRGSSPGSAEAVWKKRGASVDRPPKRGFN